MDIWAWINIAGFSIGTFMAFVAIKERVGQGKQWLNWLANAILVYGITTISTLLKQLF